MFDAKLISAALKDRAAWDKVAPHIVKDDFSPQGAFWHDIVREWYSRDKGAQSIDKDLIVAQGKKRIGNPKHEAALLGFMNDLPDAPSPDNVAQIVLELKRHNVGMELASAIAGQDTKKMPGLLKQFAELQAVTELKTRAVWEDAVEWSQLDEVVGAKNRIPLAPKLLNSRTNGGALPGHHILIFGRPEVGKSTFTLNMARGFLHSGQRVLYVGNEDNINVLKRRMRCRLTMMTEAQIAANPEAANKLAFERETENGGALFMRHLHRGKGLDLDQAVEEFEPTVLVLDQIRNMEGAAGEKMTQKLEQVAVEHRHRLAMYGLVGVSVTQAGDKTQRHGEEPPKWLTMSDVDSSRTGLPAQADLMLGIGADSEMMARNQRAVSICKNKLSSEIDSKQGFVCEFDLHRSAVKT